MWQVCLYLHFFFLGPLAQWLERLTHNQGVVGSSPTGTTFLAKSSMKVGLFLFLKKKTY